jgi:hypothetical protein
MPNFPTSDPAQFIQGCPVLHVRDVPQIAGYFRDVFGFRWDFDGEDYAVVWRDNSAVEFIKALIDPSGVYLFQWIRDLDAYYAEVRETDWGANDVIGGAHGGHGFDRPRVAVRWFRTASSVHRASLRMKPGSQLE